MSKTEEIHKKIDPEVDEELLAFRLFTGDETFLYTPKIFREKLDKNDWPVFKLQGKTGLEFAQDEDELSYKSEKGALKTASGTTKIRTLKNHIKGWNKNVLNKKGEPLKFMSGNNGIPDKFIKLFPPALQTDLYEAINNQSTMTEEELTGLEP